MEWTGYLRLAVAPKQGKTIATDLYYENAFKLTRPLYPDESGQPHYYILNPGGGYVDGDRYKLDIELAEDARLLLTTQSSTKVYKTRNTAPVQDMEIRMKKGSFLEYVPDPLIAYRHAQYKQKTTIRMERGSTLIFSDIVTPGWSPDGALFSYDRLRLKTEIYVDGDLAVYDQVRLAPSEQDLTGIGLLEGYTHFGSLIVVGEQMTSDFPDQLYEAMDAGTAPCRVGLSMLPVPGFSVRVLASSTQDIERLFAACQRLVREQWLGLKPVFLRKY
ncbi:urease accessory protein UreD [Paenibacillus elgii]